MVNKLERGGLEGYTLTVTRGGSYRRPVVSPWGKISSTKAHKPPTTDIHSTHFIIIVEYLLFIATACPCIPTVGRVPSVDWEVISLIIVVVTLISVEDV